MRGETFVGRTLRVRRPQATDRRLRRVDHGSSTCIECTEPFDGLTDTCRWCRARLVELGIGDPAQLSIVDEPTRRDVAPDDSSSARSRRGRSSSTIERLRSRAIAGTQLALALAVPADLPSVVPVVEKRDPMAEDTPIVTQLKKDVTEASALLMALSPGDELVGYQTTLIIRRADGTIDTAHAAVAGEEVRREVGHAVREATMRSWPE